MPSLRRSIAGLTGLLIAALLATSCGGAAGPTRSPITWERIDPDPDGETGPLEIVARGDGYVGVGGGSAWVSTDGRTWQAVPLPDAGDGGATGLVSAGGGLVAVGSVSRLAAVWTSVDGASWQRVTEDADLRPAAGFASTEISHVAAGPAGLVAVGVEWGTAGQRPGAWRSVDGRDWVRATTPPTGSGARDVVAFADGYVLAAADVASGGEMARAAFWSSTDGLEWVRAPDDPSFHGAEPYRLAARGGTVVAVGYRVTPVGPAPMAWSSADGTAWIPATDTPALAWWPFPGPTPVGGQGALQGTAMQGVGTGWSGFIAVGSSWGLDPSRQQPDGTFALVIRGGDVWRSADGRAWELLPDPLLSVSSPGMSTLAYGLVGVGEVGGMPVISGTAPEGGATLWLGPASAE